MGVRQLHIPVDAGLLEYVVQLGIGAGAVVGAADNADAKPALMPAAGAPIRS